MCVAIITEKAQNIAEIDIKAPRFMWHKSTELAYSNTSYKQSY